MSSIPGRWAFPATCAAALILFAVAYSNSVNGAFQFDDMHVIVHNIFIRSLENVPRFFTDAGTFSSVPLNAAYRPLVTTTLAVDYAVGGGLDPAPFHRTQLLLTATLGIMLYAFFRRVLDAADQRDSNRYVALAAALLFVVHTANSETVNYITARSDLISTMGIIGSFLVYLRWPAWRRYGVYLLPMAAGAFAKTPAVMFAPLLAAYVWFFEERASLAHAWRAGNRMAIGAVARRVAPAFLASAVLFLFIEGMRGEGASYGGAGRLDYLRTQLFVWMHYVRLFVLPMGLTADTDWEIIAHWYDTRVIAGAMFAGALLVVIQRTSSRPYGRPIAFGIAWFMLGLLPSSSVFPLAEVANEHRIFLPFAGLSLAAAWAVALGTRHVATRVSNRTRLIRRGAAAAAAAILLVLAMGTRVRNTVWASEETFWSDVVAKSPRNARALMNLGTVRMRDGDLEGARSLFERARALTNEYGYLDINLAIVHAQLGSYDVAETHYRRALELLPNTIDAYYYYARWLVDRGRASEAVPLLERAIAVSEAALEPRVLLMHLYCAMGNDDALLALARRTLDVLPSDSTAAAYARGEVPVTPQSPDVHGYFARGLGYTAADNHLLAAVAYRAALRRSPELPDVHNNLGWARAKLGFFAEAIPAFEHALRLSPRLERARNNLEWVRSQLGAAAPR